MTHIIAVLLRGKIWYYKNITALDSVKANAHVFSSIGGADNIARDLKKNKDIKSVFIFPTNKTVAHIKKTVNEKNKVVRKKVKKKAIKKVKKKNPIEGSKKRRENKAAKLYEEFTGHDADEFEIVTIPDYDTGLKVGRCLGIMYETIRDGNKENYCHEFRKTSQPDFCVSHDGQQIFLIGGDYLFKDSGINDT